MPILIGGLAVRSVELGSLAFLADPQGVQWVVESIDGWDSSPASTLAVTQKLRGPGGYRSSDPQMVARPVTLAGHVTAPDRPSVLAAIRQFKSACSLGLTELAVDELAGGLWILNVSRHGEVLLKDVGDRSYKFSVQLLADDPRKLGLPQTATAYLPSTTGGLTAPFTLPYSIGAVTNTGTVSLTNQAADQGGLNGPVTVRFNGPVAAPTVSHVAPDGSIDVLSLSLTLGATEWVDVDMEAETVLAQGQAERSMWLTSRGFSQFEPGINSWSFSAGAYNAGASMTVTARPASE